MVHTSRATGAARHGARSPEPGWVAGLAQGGMTVVLALPYSAGLAVPVWIVVVSVWASRQA